MGQVPKGGVLRSNIMVVYFHGTMTNIIAIEGLRPRGSAEIESR